jgi:CBS domain-containing protein
MKRNVVSVHASTTARDASQLIVEKRVGTLPVLDEDGNLLGVVRISDVLKVFMPDFVPLLANVDFVKDYGAFRKPSVEDLERSERISMSDIMSTPVAVEEDCSLIRALSMMEKRNLQDLPVVKEGKLVGIASRVDIGRAFLAGWQSCKDGDPEVR